MKRCIGFLVIIFIGSCAVVKDLPKKTYPFYFNFDRSYKNDTVYFHLKNPVRCPLRVKLLNDENNPGLQSLFGEVVLKESQDTIIKVNYPNFNGTERSKYSSLYGDLNKKIVKNEIALPFPKGRSYLIIQGFNGKFSHNSMWSKYSIDFDLKIGDTITSVDDGYVVGVIEKYKDHGTSRVWRNNDRSNYVTIYHPHSGLFSQYAHLDYNGAIVNIGDAVKKGQPIAISGMTGFTTIEHLHFSVKIPTVSDGLIATDYEFENQKSTKEFKRKDVITH